jgi:uncharacterized membrane protein YccC
MSLDDVFIGIVVGGMVLSGAYMRSEYRRWRKLGADEQRRGSAQRDLHAARLIERSGARLQGSVAQLQTFTHANEAASQESAGRGSVRGVASPSDRRAREKHSAAH